jgi:hypothetical protein
LLLWAARLIDYLHEKGGAELETEAHEWFKKFHGRAALADDEIQHSKSEKSDIPGQIPTITDEEQKRLYSIMRRTWPDLWDEGNNTYLNEQERRRVQEDICALILAAPAKEISREVWENIKAHIREGREVKDLAERELGIKTEEKK